MLGYLFGFGAACLLSLVGTWWLSRWAKRRELFMPPIRQRDVHREPTPRVGGVAIVGAFLVTVVAIVLIRPDFLAFISQKTLGIDRNLLGLILAIIVLGVVNLADDWQGTPIWLRLGTEILAALLVFWFGIHVQWLSSPAGGRLLLGSLDWLFVVIWLVGLSNVVNWLDGINGLAAGVVAITLAILFFLSRDVHQYSSAMLSVVALGAVVGFLPFNFGQPAKAFLGDTGSVFLGFLIGVIAIIAGGKVATAFLVLAIPFLDALAVFTTRLIHHQSPFRADQRHLHHRLLALGFRQWQIVGLFYLVSFIFGLIALNTQTVGKTQAAAGALILVVLLVIGYSYWGNRKLKKKVSHG